MQTVGEMLRSERERKGLTLKDVELETNIRVMYLNAIELGNYSVIPGEAYLKGFIRNYANMLGLNGAEYVELYRKNQEGTSSTSAPSVKVALEDKPPVLTQPEPSSEPASTESPQLGSAAARRRERTRKMEHMLLLVIVFLLALAGIWLFAGSDTPREQTALQEQSLSSTPQQPAAPLPVATTQSQMTNSGKPITVSANFLAQSWIQVVVDDKKMHEGIFQAGEKLNWQAEQKLMIKIGNAAAVELTYNNNFLGKMGAANEVVVKSFTAQAN